MKKSVNYEGDKMENTTCCICLENKFNRSTKAKSTCVYCNTAYCRTCLKEYIKRIDTDFKCANCLKSWNDDHLYNMLPKTFVEVEVRAMRTKKLLEQEKQLLPSTMEIAILYRDLNNEINYHTQECALLKTEVQKLPLEDKIGRKKIKKQIDNINFQIFDIKFAIYKILNGEDTELLQENVDLLHFPVDLLQENVVEEEEKEVFFKNCPIQKCNGYLSTKWKCGMCGIKVCKDCLEIKEDNENHNCKPENVESANEIKQSCKDCPKCKAKIYRVSGCPQMWCVKCHTAFNWHTGKIEKGKIHNPEYFEWLRRNRPIINVDECVQNVTYLQVKDEINRRNMVDESEKILDVFRKVIEIDDMNRREYEVPNLEQKNKKLRILYLNNEIDEHEFSRQLFLTDVRYRKNMEIIEIINMIVEASNIIFQKFVDKQVMDIMLELEELSKLVDNQWKFIHNKYKYGTKKSFNIFEKVRSNRYFD